MLTLSHRGYHEQLPENTMDAFSAALGLGVDGIETDVRLSSDGFPILYHDRFSPCGRPVAALTRAELEKQTGHPVAVLQEALGAWDQPLWNIEIKTPSAVPAVIDVLTRFKKTHRLLVTSFFHGLLLPFASGLGVDCGVISAHQPVDASQFLAQIRQMHPKIVAAVWSFELLCGDVCDAARENRLLSFVYDVSNRSDLRACEELAVDGVIMDRPETAAVGSSSA